MGAEARGFTGLIGARVVRVAAWGCIDFSQTFILAQLKKLSPGMLEPKPPKLYPPLPRRAEGLGTGELKTSWEISSALNPKTLKLEVKV